MEQRYKLDYTHIAQHVKKARRAAQLTQAELAEKVEISTNAVGKLETNLMFPSLQTLINIANVLNLDMNVLLASESSDSLSDIPLEELVTHLSPREKTFLVHIIRGLNSYNTET